MKNALFAVTLTLISSPACADNTQPNPAEAVIDAFYTFEPDQLSATLHTSADQTARILYYQAWAQAANYEIKTRRTCTLDANIYSCRITVTDDFGKTMGYTATDTFQLTMQSQQVVGVSFEGDDPPIFDELLGWIQTNRPEVLSGPCLAFFDGGTTPRECSRAVVTSARAFMEVRESE